MLTHLSLFSGIGGLDLAAEMAGFTTVGQCEWADYPTKVLEKHWPDVPRWRDIRTLTGGSFYERTRLRTVDVISGGFPCQPHSLAGKRQGEKDERNLWPEFIRVIREIQPRYVVGENVPGILSTIYDGVCADLEGENYQVWTFCIPAYAVGAHHERYRVAVVAVNQSKPRFQTYSEANTSGTLQEAWKYSGERYWDNLPGTYWAVHKPPVFGMADGVPGGVDGRVKYKARMTALGNAVVPQQFYPIFQSIADVERMMDQTAKRDAGKPRPTLVPPKIIWAITKVREFGCTKYKDPDNWCRVEPQRYRDAAYRHWLAYLENVDSIDEESGLPSLWHLLTDIGFLVVLEWERHVESMLRRSETASGGSTTGEAVLGNETTLPSHKTALNGFGGENNES